MYWKVLSIMEFGLILKCLESQASFCRAKNTAHPPQWKGNFEKAVLCSVLTRRQTNLWISYYFKVSFGWDPHSWIVALPQECIVSAPIRRCLGLEVVALWTTQDSVGLEMHDMQALLIVLCVEALESRPSIKGLRCVCNFRVHHAPPAMAWCHPSISGKWV